LQIPSSDHQSQGWLLCIAFEVFLQLVFISVALVLCPLKELLSLTHRPEASILLTVLVVVALLVFALAASPFLYSYHA